MGRNYFKWKERHGIQIQVKHFVGEESGMQWNSKRKELRCLSQDALWLDKIVFGSRRGMVRLGLGTIDTRDWMVDFAMRLE